MENYTSPEGKHRHQCDKCGFIWEHDDVAKTNEPRHHCPNCGEQQGFRYFGDKPPSAPPAAESAPAPPAPAMTDDQLAVQFMSDMLLHASKAITVKLTLTDAFILVAQVQLAMRHPANIGPTIKVAKRFCQSIIDLAPSEAVREVMNRGFDPKFDFVRETAVPAPEPERKEK